MHVEIICLIYGKNYARVLGTCRIGMIACTFIAQPLAHHKGWMMI